MEFSTWLHRKENLGSSDLGRSQYVLLANEFKAWVSERVKAWMSERVKAWVSERVKALVSKPVKAYRVFPGCQIVHFPRWRLRQLVSLHVEHFHGLPMRESLELRLHDFRFEGGDFDGRQMLQVILRRSITTSLLFDQSKRRLDSQ